jgi:hypothetical protein
MEFMKVAAFAKIADTILKASIVISARTDSTDHTENTGMKLMSVHVSFFYKCLIITIFEIHDFPQRATATISIQLETALKKRVTVNVVLNSKHQTATLVLKDILDIRTADLANAT